MTDKKIILASGSPRRRELLAGLDVQFTVDTGNTFEEKIEAGVPAHQVPVILAQGKSHGFHRPLAADEILITADTVVIISTAPEQALPENRLASLRPHPSGPPSYDAEGGTGFQADLLPEPTVLGKPHSREEAIAMLETLSGRTHEVLTAVTIRTTEKEETFTDSTLVTFMPLSREEIETYIDKYQPYDKAGSYGVQEWIGYVAVGHIEGSFYNVMGFPVHKVWEALKKY